MNKEYLQKLATQAKTAWNNGNKSGASYLACLYGMWANHFGFKWSPVFNNTILDGWVVNGFECYVLAVRSDLSAKKGN